MADRSRFGLHMGNTTITLSTLKVNFLYCLNVHTFILFHLQFDFVQEEKSEIVASKFGDRSSYACIAATNETEFSIGLPAKQGIARNGTLTVVNNFQFLNADLTSEQTETAISKSCLCKVNRKENDELEYELSKGDDVLTKITPFQVAVNLLENSYGK